MVCMAPTTVFHLFIISYDQAGHHLCLTDTLQFLKKSLLITFLCKFYCRMNTIWVYWRQIYQYCICSDYYNRSGNQYSALSSPSLCSSKYEKKSCLTIQRIEKTTDTWEMILMDWVYYQKPVTKFILYVFTRTQFCSFLPNYKI